MSVKRKNYTGRVRRPLAMLETWAKQFLQDEEAREFLYEHTDPHTYTQVHEALVKLANIRDELYTYVRE